MYRKKSISYI
ncbi:hypothetical protein RDI58_013688 [Solanum bulbocastanum]|uniref:Uncharacterized protein n=1 Tax=Solanum bulbocastanum TaxID=147425 RepID=A0AAN8TK04_SOLBU